MDYDTRCTEPTAAGMRGTPRSLRKPRLPAARTCPRGSARAAPRPPIARSLLRARVVRDRWLASGIDTVD